MRSKNYWSGSNENKWAGLIEVRAQKCDAYHLDIKAGVVSFGDKV